MYALYVAVTQFYYLFLLMSTGSLKIWFVFQTKIEAIKQDRQTAAESTIRTQFKMEMIVYTQDRTYSQSLIQMKKEGEVMSDEMTVPVVSTMPKIHMPGPSVKERQERRTTIYSSDKHATLQEMMLHLKSYFNVSYISYQFTVRGP